MSTQNTAQAVAQILDPVLGDAVSDDAFAALVDEIVSDLAARFAALDAKVGSVG